MPSQRRPLVVDDIGLVIHKAQRVLAQQTRPNPVDPDTVTITIAAAAVEKNKSLILHSLESQNLCELDSY